MTRLTILAVACMPLLWLTVNSFRNAHVAIEQMGPGGSTTRVDLAEITEKAAEAKRGSEVSRPFLRELSKLELFSEGPLRQLGPETTVDFKPIVECWSNYTRTCEPAVRLAAIYRENLTSEKEREELEVFLRSHPFPAGIRGAASLEEMLKQRVSRIEGEANAKWKLERARKALNQGRYDEALSNLTIADDHLEAREKEEVDRMRRKALFRKHWASNSGIAGETPLQRLEWLLKSPPEPVDDQDRKLLADRVLERDTLLRKARLEELLASNEPLAARLDKIRSLATEDASSKPVIRTRLREWVELLIPRKKPPVALVGQQEAWYKNGKYRRGLFVPMAPITATDKFFHVWDDLAARNARPLFYDTIYESELRESPRKVLPLSIVEDFNDKRDRLLRSIVDKELWRKFEEFCKSQQRDIDDYYLDVGKDQNPQISLIEDQKSTKQILEVWDNFHELMDTSRD